MLRDYRKGTCLFLLIVGEDGETEGLCVSFELSTGGKSVAEPCERVKDVESGISVRPLIFKILAVSKTCKASFRLLILKCHLW